MKYVIIIFQTKWRIYSSQGSFTSEGVTNLILLKKGAQLLLICSTEVIKKSALTSLFFNNRKQSPRGVLQKGALRNFQNLQENTCARVSFFLKKLQTSAATLLKRRLWYRYFPVNFAKFLWTLFLTIYLPWLLLNNWNYRHCLIYKNFTCSLILTTY